MAANSEGSPPAWVSRWAKFDGRATNQPTAGAAARSGSPSTGSALAANAAASDDTASSPARPGPPPGTDTNPASDRSSRAATNAAAPTWRTAAPNGLAR